MPMVPTISGAGPREARAVDERALRDAGLGAFFRPSQLEDALGLDYADLRRLVEAGTFEHVAHGLYHLAAAEPTEHHTLAAVCALVPRSIVCLLSALKVHGIGTQLPQEVWLAIPHKARAPRVGIAKVRLFRFSGAAWTYGIEDVQLEGVPARITSPARTIVDCFRFESQIGREAAMEALRDGLRHRRVTIEAIDRVEEVLPSRTLRAALQVIAA